MDLPAAWTYPQLGPYVVIRMEVRRAVVGRRGGGSGGGGRRLERREREAAGVDQSQGPAGESRSLVAGVRIDGSMRK